MSRDRRPVMLSTVPVPHRSCSNGAHTGVIHAHGNGTRSKLQDVPNCRATTNQPLKRVVCVSGNIKIHSIPRPERFYCALVLYYVDRRISHDAGVAG